MPHAIVAWSVTTPDAHEDLRACLDGRSWVRPLDQLYVVRLRGEREHAELVEDLKAVARSRRGQVRLLVGPLIEGGHYSGWLRTDLWEGIARRTEEEP